jgi:Cu+-exporting ATPase
MNDIELVAFDKTGTLTLGAPRLEGVIAPAGADRSDASLVTLAARLEAGDPHPVARALLEAARPAVEPLPEVERAPGRGLSATDADGRRLLLGSERLLREHGVSLPAGLAEAAERARHNGELVVWLAEDDVVLAGLRFADAIRSEAPAVLASLAERGLAVAMVSGDAETTCRAVATRLGIDDVHGEVLPHEKESVVRELQKRGTVAFVGDGLNDAAALAAADLAIGIAGSSDLAVLAADVVLVGAADEPGGSSPLAATVGLLAIARATRRVIRQNLAWAFTYNAVAFPLAATGRLSPVWAAVAMAGSSIAVVLNSLRLSVTRRWRATD